MIVILHLIYFMASALISVVSNSMLTLPLAKSEARVDDEDESIEPPEGFESNPNTVSTESQSETRKSYVQDMEPIEGLQFVPPVYSQRYMAVQEILMDMRWTGNIKKVVDFGCAEFGFFKHMKHVPGVQEILTVDIDEELLNHCSCRVAPLVADFLSNRKSPLRVQVFAGSIAKLDRCLLGTDAVVCIEVIEHLWPDEVEAVPYTVFGFIKPQVAIFTTPNSDFNVLFTNFTGFRHIDHKFEWSRDQFQCWASNIVSRYPDYEVTLHGIGAGPPGTENYGHCSQMAVFVKQASSFAGASQREEEAEDIFTKVCEYEYPFRVDGRTDDEKILHEAEYNIRLLGLNEDYCHDDGITEVPVSMLMPDVEKWCNSEEKLITILTNNGWTMSDRDPKITAVIYPYFLEGYNSSLEDDHEEEEVPDLLKEKEITGALDEDDWNLTNQKDEVDWDEESVLSSKINPVDMLKTTRGDSGTGNNQQIRCLQTCQVENNTWCTNETNISSTKIIAGVCADTNDTTPIAQHSNIATNGLHEDVKRDRKRIAMDSCFSGLDLPSSSSMNSGSMYLNKSVHCYASYPSTCAQQAMSDSLLVSVSESENAMNDFDVDSSSDECNYIDNSHSEQDMDLDLSPDHSDNSLSDDSQGCVNIDNQVNPPNPRVQLHRNNVPFPVVENGDVANNNRDGEGNNAAAVIEEVNIQLGVIDVEEIVVNDVDDNQHVEEDNEEDEDFENDNNELLIMIPIMPDGHDIHQFPHWLLNLIEIVNHDGP